MISKKVRFVKFFCGGKLSKIVGERERDGQRNGVDEKLELKLESLITAMMIVHITF